MDDEPNDSSRSVVAFVIVVGIVTILGAAALRHLASAPRADATPGMAAETPRRAH